MSDNLPDGVINAAPPGAFEDADAVDGETAERNAVSIDSPGLTESGLAPNSPGDVSGPIETDEDIESDEPSQGVDADLAPGDEDES